MSNPPSSGPSSFGPSLLAKSKANPGNVDMSIFAPKTKPVGQGAVSSDYLQKTREDNPSPESSEQRTDSVSLGACKITTPPAELLTDQPFEMSVEAKGAGTVTFNLFCTLPKADGTEEIQDQSSPSEATIAGGVAKTKGTLVSPKTPVSMGTKLKYHVVAEHPNAKEKSTSDKVEVEAGKAPKPLAVLTLGAVHFGFGSSFVLPSAAEKIAEFRKAIEANPGAAVAVFGHADPVGDDDPNKGLAGRRAYAAYSLLAKKADGWSDLAKGATGDKWDLHHTQAMLKHLKDEAGAAYYGGSVDGKDGPKTQAAVKAFQKVSGLAVDGVAGPKTHAALYAKYMDEICPTTCAPEDFVGDPQDGKRQWACVGCGEFNPVLVFGQSDADKYAKDSDKSERDAKNSVNRRATIFLFPATAKGPGMVQFPCPARDEGTAKCKAQFFDDGDTRRHPQNAERTWEKDQNTFACKFYAQIAKDEGASAGGTSEWGLVFDAAAHNFKGLATKLREPEFILWCSNIFGFDLQEATYRKLREDLLADKVPSPKYEVSEKDLNGHEASYRSPSSPEALSEAAVHIAPSVAQAAWDDATGGLPCWKLYTLLIHEYGHHLDYLLRHHYETAANPDAQLDEGALFAYALIPLDAEKAKFHKVCTLEHGGQKKEITASLEQMSEALEIYSGEAVQEADQKQDLIEYFEAGSGHGGCSYGHRSVEYELGRNLRWLDSKNVELTSQSTLLYFGNWLRDYSQFIDPKVMVLDQTIARTIMTNVVDFLAYREFYWSNKSDAPIPGKNRKDFEVTTVRLGLYRPEEHIDNPCGIEATTTSDSFPDTKFRSACPPGSVELKPHPTTWVSQYITDPSANSLARRSSTHYVRNTLRTAFSASNEVDFLRHLGGAFHTMEDLFAHSNFLELALRSYCGKPNVAPWVAQDPTIHAHPLVTGSFGGLDTACSIIYTIVELWEAYDKESDEKKKYKLHLLLANFLIDDNKASLSVPGFSSLNYAEQLRKAVKIAFLLSNHENASGEVPKDWPSELKSTAGTLLEWYHKYQKAGDWVDQFNLYKKVQDLLNDTSDFFSKLKIQVLMQALKLYAKNVGDFQTSQKGERPGYPKIPTHSQLAKDHDDHPLHELAAKCASRMIVHLGSEAWRLRQAGASASSAADQIAALAEAYIFHPDKFREGTTSETLPLRQEILEMVKNWSLDPANQNNLIKLENPGWLAGQDAVIFHEIQEIETKGKKLFASVSRAPESALASRAEACMDEAVA